MKRVYEKENNIYIHYSRLGTPASLGRDLRTLYGTSRIQKLFSDRIFKLTGRAYKINNFFAPELLYITYELYNLTRKTRYLLVHDDLRNNTWVKSMYEPSPSTISLTKLNELNFSPKPYQKEFI